MFPMIIKKLYCIAYWISELLHLKKLIQIFIDLICGQLSYKTTNVNKKRIERDSSIKISIDKFIEHCNLEYQKYLDDIGIYSCEYHRDREFIFKYLNM
jgi:hypothetical protein